MRLSTFSRKINETGVFRPQLTSLVDVMTILLVFLIKSFSVENNVFTPPSDIDLPLSTSVKPPQPRCALNITPKAILAEGKTIIALESLEDDSLMIEPLFVFLREKREICTVDSSASLLIQSDKDVQFFVLKKVMYTCSKAGIENFSVLVIREH